VPGHGLVTRLHRVLDTLEGRQAQGLTPSRYRSRRSGHVGVP